MTEVLDVKKTRKPTLKTLPNYISLGQGVNIFTLDPITMLSSTSVPVFDLDEGGYREQGGYRIPNGCNYNPIYTAYSVKDSLVLNTSEEYSTNFQSKGGFSVGVPGIFSLGLSHKYSEFNKKIVTHDKTFVLAYGTKEEYSLSFDDSKKNPKLKLSSNFIEALTSLPLTWHIPHDGNAWEKDEYFKFIKKFGTHYSNKVIFGGKVYQTTQISKETREELKEEKIDIGESSKAVIEEVEVDGNTNFENEKVQKYYEKTERESSKLLYVGGEPKKDIIEFLDSVTENPKAISLGVLPISDLLLFEQYFDSTLPLEERLKIQENLNNAIVHYVYEELECSAINAIDGVTVNDEYVTSEYQMVTNQNPTDENQYYWFNSAEQQSDSWRLAFYPGSGSIYPGKIIAGQLQPATVDCKVDKCARHITIKANVDKSLQNFSVSVIGSTVAIAADDGKEIFLWKGILGEELKPISLEQIEGLRPSISFYSQDNLILSFSNRGLVNQDTNVFEQEAYCCNVNIKSEQIESKITESFSYNVFEGNPDSGELDVNVACYQGSIIWTVGQRAKKSDSQVFTKAGYIADNGKIKLSEKKDNVGPGRFPTACVLGRQVVLAYTHHSNNSLYYKIGYQTGLSINWVGNPSVLLDKNNQLTPDGSKISLAITSKEMNPLVAIGLERKAFNSYPQAATQSVMLGVLG